MYLNEELFQRFYCCSLAKGEKWAKNLCVLLTWQWIREFAGKAPVTSSQSDILPTCFLVFFFSKVAFWVSQGILHVSAKLFWELNAWEAPQLLFSLPLTQRWHGCPFSSQILCRGVSAFFYSRLQFALALIHKLSLVSRVSCGCHSQPDFPPQHFVAGLSESEISQWPEEFCLSVKIE